MTCGNSTLWYVPGTGPGEPEAMPRDLLSPSWAAKIVYGAASTWRSRARNGVIRAYKGKFFSCWMYSRSDVLGLIGVTE